MLKKISIEKKQQNLISDQIYTSIKNLKID